jgi:hypothetical protein
MEAGGKYRNADRLALAGASMLAGSWPFGEKNLAFGLPQSWMPLHTAM